MRQFDLLVELVDCQFVLFNFVEEGVSDFEYCLVDCRFQLGFESLKELVANGGGCRGQFIESIICVVSHALFQIVVLVLQFGDLGRDGLEITVQVELISHLTVSDVQHVGFDGGFKKRLGEGGLGFLIGLVMFL